MSNKILEDIKHDIRTHVEEYLFEPVSKEIFSKLSHNIHATLNNYSTQNRVKDYEIGRIKTVWQTYSLWQKIRYPFLRLLFKDEIHLFYECLHAPLTEELREQFMGKNFKWWYQNYPRSTLVCKVAVQPIKALDFVTLKFTLSASGATFEDMCG